MATQTSPSWLQRNRYVLLFALLALVVVVYRTVQTNLYSPKSTPAGAMPSPAVPGVAFKASSVPSGLAFFKTLHEQGAGFDLVVNYPYLQSLGDPFTTSFDRAIETFVERMANSFKANTHQDAVFPTNMTADYRVLYNSDGLVSLYFEITTVSAGAAHPGNSSMVFNYSSKLNRELGLADLFQPSSGYLQVLSAYCTGRLKEDGQLAFERGALPTGENYRNWNITANGLMITFDPYQVAPYSAGYLQVTVPYSVFETIIDPQGPLAGIGAH